MLIAWITDQLTFELFITYKRLSVISIFALVDSEGQFLPVTVYNMAVGSGFAVGDSVAIPEPFCQGTNFTENEQVNEFISKGLVIWATFSLSFTCL